MIVLRSLETVKMCIRDRDTGAQLSTLATWDGFFEMAGAYRQWSQGKPFCALDYPLRRVELNALEQGSGELYKLSLIHI